MTWVHKTMIVAAQDAPLARALAVAAAGESGDRMFTTGLSADGAAPATHYISAGLIHEEFAALFGDAAATAQATGGQVPAEAIEGLYSRAVLSEDEPFSVLDRMGLKLVQEAQ